MTTADRNDLIPAPAQEKLQWVTPKISLMDAEDTDGTKFNYYKFEIT
jgi:hypothetical protein